MESLKGRRWRRIRIEANGDESIPAWSLGDYLLYENVNHGAEPPEHPAGRGRCDRHGHHWWFEVHNGKRLVGEAPSLKSAKALACADAREN